MVEQFGDLEFDEAVGAASLFAVVFLIYFFGLPMPGENSLVVYGWAILSVFAVLSVKLMAAMPVVFFYVVLLIFYVYGAARVGLLDGSLGYVRVIATSFVFSSFLYAICIVGGQRKSLIFGFHEKTWIVFQKIFLLAIVAWTFLSLRYMKLNHQIDFRLIVSDSYLTVSDLFALFALSMISRKKISSREIFGVVFAVLFVLVFLGSRASMVLFLFSAMCILLKKGFSICDVCIVLIAFFPAVILFFANFDFDNSIFFRVNSIFSLATDESRMFRSYLAQQMLDEFYLMPSCLIVACQPQAGMYSHNLFSVVQYFGVFGLVLMSTFFVVTIFSLKYIYASWWFGIFLYVSLSVIFFRAWVSPVFPVLVAFILIMVRQLCVHDSSKPRV